MEFQYFYKRQAEIFSFLRLPIVLMEDEKFKSISIESKVLYSYMLNRLTLSYKNKWIDEMNRIYIYFTVDEIKEKLNCGNEKAIKILNELKQIGLIETKRQGLGKPNKIYVKNFMSIFEKQELLETKNKKYENRNSRIPKIENEEIRKSKTTNIDNIKIDNSNIDNRKSYGIFDNVKLNDKEYTELSEILKHNLEEYINRLSSYIKSTDKKYKDHKATIILWYLKDNKNNKLKSNIPTVEEYEKGDSL